MPFAGVLRGRKHGKAFSSSGNVLTLDPGHNASEYISKNFYQAVRLRCMHFTACVSDLIKKCPTKLLPLLLPFNLPVAGPRKRRVVWGLLRMSLAVDQSLHSDNYF